MLVDAHLHLQDPQFAGRSSTILQRAAHQGVGLLLCNATREEDWQAVTAFAHAQARIFPFYGVHPWYAGAVADGWQDRLALLLRQPDCGVGEIGLDRRCGVDRELQEQVFMNQLDLAVGLQRPVTIHCVRCWGRLADLLAAAGPARLPPVLIHSFGGSVETMRQLGRLGCRFGFSLRLFSPWATRQREVLGAAPLAQVLLETDAPAPLPEGFPTDDAGGLTTAEPSLIGRLYRYCAELRGMEIQEFIDAVRNNAAVFTGKAPSR